MSINSKGPNWTICMNRTIKFEKTTKHDSVFVCIKVPEHFLQNSTCAKSTKSICCPKTVFSWSTEKTKLFTSFMSITSTTGIRYKPIQDGNYSAISNSVYGLNQNKDTTNLIFIKVFQLIFNELGWYCCWKKLIYNLKCNESRWKTLKKEKQTLKMKLNRKNLN